MCGRFVLTSPPDVLAALFRLEYVPTLSPRYIIAPTQPVPAVRVSGEASRALSMLHWGLLPVWAKDKSIGSRLINARAETVAEKPAFRNAFRRRRCLIPADGFYEWQKRGSEKQPHYIHRADGEPLAFAGLWERWEKGEEPIESCTILTTEPNALMAELHNRMPVVVEPEDFARYLDPELAGEAVADLLRPAAEGVLTAYPVTRHVNTPSAAGRSRSATASPANSGSR
ncbi:MAG: SOS response-associated peptidase [Phycisphaerales bacterium JB038]